jgi:hypothetical protein
MGLFAGRIAAVIWMQPIKPSAQNTAPCLPLPPRAICTAADRLGIFTVEGGIAGAVDCYSKN